MSNDPKGLCSLKRFKAETGLSAVSLAGMIKVPVSTVERWLSPSGRNPPHDGLLELAVAEARRRYAAGCVKAKVIDDPCCPFCGELFVLLEVSRGKFTVSHRCRSGVAIKIPERPKDELLYALTQLVRSE